ncbi:hypothetical protein [Paenibacillus sp. FSL R10-2736]|uniref:hypothetical protein n=1 Tax=Paenibacillus sp. FSL R10-2736 TaxID=2954692 RepID=UPI0030F526DA
MCLAIPRSGCFPAREGAYYTVVTMDDVGIPEIRVRLKNGQRDKVKQRAIHPVGGALFCLDMM